MSTAESTTVNLSSELLAEFQKAAEDAVKGVRNLEAMAKACQEMDRLREEIRRRHGILNIAVPAIRELRDE